MLTGVIIVLTLTTSLNTMVEPSLSLNMVCFHQKLGSLSICDLLFRKYGKDSLVVLGVYGLSNSFNNSYSRFFHLLLL
jgi:hypothetical protein